MHLISIQKYISKFFVALSMFDLVYLMIGIAIFGLPVLSMDYKAKIFPFILPIGFGICNIARVGSVFVTMSVTIERYFAIVHPLRVFNQKKLLLPTPIFCTLLYNIPKFFELERSEVSTTDSFQSIKISYSNICHTKAS